LARSLGTLLARGLKGVRDRRANFGCSTLLVASPTLNQRLNELGEAVAQTKDIAQQDLALKRDVTALREQIQPVTPEKIRVAFLRGDPLK
jgi:hypothetical protein